MSFGVVSRILLCLLGLALVSVGCFIWFAPLGFMYCGVSLILIAYVWQYLRAAGTLNEIS